MSDFIAEMKLREEGHSGRVSTHPIAELLICNDVFVEDSLVFLSKAPIQIEGDEPECKSIGLSNSDRDISERTVVLTEWGIDILNFQYKDALAPIKKPRIAFPSSTHTLKSRDMIKPFARTLRYGSILNTIASTNKETIKYCHSKCIEMNNIREERDRKSSLRYPRKKTQQSDALLKPRGLSFRGRGTLDVLMGWDRVAGVVSYGDIADSTVASLQDRDPVSFTEDFSPAEDPVFIAWTPSIPRRPAYKEAAQLILSNELLATKVYTTLPLKKYAESPTLLEITNDVLSVPIITEEPVVKLVIEPVVKLVIEPVKATVEELVMLQFIEPEKDPAIISALPLENLQDLHTPVLLITETIIEKVEIEPIVDIVQQSPQADEAEDSKWLLDEKKKMFGHRWRDSSNEVESGSLRSSVQNSPAKFIAKPVPIQSTSSSRFDRFAPKIIPNEEIMTEGPPIDIVSRNSTNDAVVAPYPQNFGSIIEVPTTKPAPVKKSRLEQLMDNDQPVLINQPSNQILQVIANEPSKQILAVQVVTSAQDEWATVQKVTPPVTFHEKEIVIASPIIVSEGIYVAPPKKVKAELVQVITSPVEFVKKTEHSSTQKLNLDSKMSDNLTNGVNDRRRSVEIDRLGLEPKKKRGIFASIASSLLKSKSSINVMDDGGISLSTVSSRETVAPPPKAEKIQIEMPVYQFQIIEEIKSFERLNSSSPNQAHTMQSIEQLSCAISCGQLMVETENLRLSTQNRPNSVKSEFLPSLPDKLDTPKMKSEAVQLPIVVQPSKSITEVTDSKLPTPAVPKSRKFLNAMDIATIQSRNSADILAVIPALIPDVTPTVAIEKPILKAAVETATLAPAESIASLNTRSVEQRKSVAQQSEAESEIWVIFFINT